MKHITKYKVFESESNIIGTIKNRDEIDFDMINEAKDMALEYLDDGYTLEIDVYFGIIENTINVDKPQCKGIIYSLKYSHDVEKTKWYTVPGGLQLTGNYDLIMYYFIIYKEKEGEYTEDSDKSFEIVSRIMEAYPNKYKYATKTQGNYHIYIDNILYKEVK